MLLINHQFYALAIHPKRRNEGSQSDYSGFDKQPGHLADAADIFAPVSV